MKAEIKLFWKFFFEQKLDEAWNFIKNIPNVLIGISVILLFAALFIGGVYLIGLIMWLTLHTLSVLPPKLNILNTDNVFSIGTITAMTSAVILVIVITVYDWIKSNVDKAIFRVELELNREKDNESKR